MALADDIASDLASFDGAETVSLYDSSANTTDSTVTALRRVLSHRDIQMGLPVGVEPQDVVFHLQQSTTAISPVPGDKITDSGNTAFQILSVNKETLGTRWRCMCRQQK